MIRKLDPELNNFHLWPHESVVRTPFTVEGGTVATLFALVKRRNKAPEAKLDVGRRRSLPQHGHPVGGPPDAWAGRPSPYPAAARVRQSATTSSVRGQAAPAKKRVKSNS